jgi:hypothetical protein
MKHPFENIQPQYLNRWFWVSLVGCIFLMVVFNQAGKPLTTSVAPSGIVSYELAGTASKSAAILASWDGTTKLLAAFGIGLDYVFMFAYAGALSLGSIWASRTLTRSGWPLAGMGRWLAWGVFAAALLDAIENVGLLVQMTSGAQDTWAFVARIAAIVKFGLIFLGMIYVFYALAVFVITHLMNTKHNHAKRDL